MKKRLCIVLTLAILLLTVTSCAQKDSLDAQQKTYSVSALYAHDNQEREVNQNIAAQCKGSLDFVLAPGAEEAFALSPEADETVAGPCAVATVVRACFQKMDRKSVLDWNPHSESEGCICDEEGQSRLVSEDAGFEPVSLHQGDALRVKNTQSLPLRLRLSEALTPQGVLITAVIEVDAGIPLDLYEEYEEYAHYDGLTLDSSGLDNDSLSLFVNDQAENNGEKTDFQMLIELDDGSRIVQALEQDDVKDVLYYGVVNQELILALEKPDHCYDLVGMKLQDEQHAVVSNALRSNAVCRDVFLHRDNTETGDKEIRITGLPMLVRRSWGEWILYAKGSSRETEGWEEAYFHISPEQPWEVWLMREETASDVEGGGSW